MLTGGSGGAHSQADTATRPRRLVPAYFYPDLQAEPSRWRRLCDGTAPAGSIVVVNPASGPGRAVDDAYTEAIELCAASGQQVVGYVHTTYGARDARTVRRDMDTYAGLYPALHGLFVDEMSNDPSTLGYYQEVYDHAKSRMPEQCLVVGNPGCAAASAWQLATPVADLLVVFEESWECYRTWRAPDWTADVAPWLVHLVHGVPGPELISAAAEAASRRPGFAYVTDDPMPNPWDTLPGWPVSSSDRGRRATPRGPSG